MRAIARMSAIAVALMVTAAPAYAQPADDEAEAAAARCALFDECEQANEPADDEVVGSQEGEVADGTPRRPRTRGRLEIAGSDEPQARSTTVQRQRSTGRRSTRAPGYNRQRRVAVRPVRRDGNFVFNTGSATLTSVGWQNARTWAAQMMSRPSTQRVRIVGHTDASGDAERNRVLSMARAQAVADAFVSSGVDRSRLEVVGMGEELASRDRAPTSARHRRVEIAPIRN